MNTVTTATRVLLDVDLEPVTGSRFQPTGFPDLGAALFKRPLPRSDGDPRWVDALVVESAQSVANRLEAATWDEGAQQPVAALAGLPYVRVVHADDGGYLTSSRTEAHRLASAFVKDATIDEQDMRAWIRARLGLRDDRPVAPRDIARAVFALDPLCLLHGVFFAEPASVWPGQPKVARALTGFVEAWDVMRADSGGVKRDHVRHSLGEAEGGTAEGYGTVPFHRTEWTAQRIVASFSLDLAQLRSYGLGEDGSMLLEAIGRWEVRALLDAGLRLRTACDLVPTSEIVDRTGQPWPTLEQLEADIRRGVDACAELLGGGQPIDVRWAGGKKRVKG